MSNSGANSKPRFKSLKELMEMVHTIVKTVEKLDKELAKFTELDMQKMVAGTRTTTENLAKMSNELTALAELLPLNEQYELPSNLDRLSTVLSAEYDSKFIGEEK